MSLAGKVALITGGLGGLGKAFAVALLQQKISTVCLVDLVNNGGTVASQIAQKYSPSRVDYVQCDVTNYQSFQDVIVGAKRKYGHLDILCNNAGISCLDSDVERSTQAIRVNLDAVYYGTKLGMEHMSRNSQSEGGVIINIASMAAFLKVQGTMVYCATKAGVVQLTRAAAMDFSDTGVRINALCPSFADTPILDSLPGLRESLAGNPDHPILSAEFVAEGFMRLVLDETKNGAVMRVTPQNGIDYYEYSRRDRSKL